MTMSFSLPMRAGPSMAPTVSTKGSSPGLLIVPLLFPRLPAAATTRTPAFQTCSTA